MNGRKAITNGSIQLQSKRQKRNRTTQGEAGLTYEAGVSKNVQIVEFLRYNYLFWLIAVVPFKIDFKSFSNV